MQPAETGSDVLTPFCGDHLILRQHTETVVSSDHHKLSRRVCPPIIHLEMCVFFKFIKENQADRQIK